MLNAYDVLFQTEQFTMFINLYNKYRNGQIPLSMFSAKLEDLQTCFQVLNGIPITIHEDILPLFEIAIDPVPYKTGKIKLLLQIINDNTIQDVEGMIMSYEPYAVDVYFYFMDFVKMLYTTKYFVQRLLGLSNDIGYRFDDQLDDIEEEYVGLLRRGVRGLWNRYNLSGAQDAAYLDQTHLKMNSLITQGQGQYFFKQVVNRIDAILYKTAFELAIYGPPHLDYDTARLNDIMVLSLQPVILILGMISGEAKFEKSVLRGSQNLRIVMRHILNIDPENPQTIFDNQNMQLAQPMVEMLKFLATKIRFLPWMKDYIAIIIKAIARSDQFRYKLEVATKDIRIFTGIQAQQGMTMKELYKLLQYNPPLQNDIYERDDII